MPVFKVTAKWGKTIEKGIECNTEESPDLFKAQLFNLFNVLPENQKIMLKGKVLKDDSWKEFPVTDGSTMLVMGQASEKVLLVDTIKSLQVNDLQKDSTDNSLTLPVGLTNLGNTCYANATLQCLKSCQELTDAMKKLSAAQQSQPNYDICSCIKDLFVEMETTKSGEVTPARFMTVLKSKFPQFASMTSDHKPQQQDACECWSSIIQAFKGTIPSLPSSTGGPSKMGDFVEQFFEIKLDSKVECTEEGDKSQPQTSSESQTMLSCYIDKDVKYLFTGLNNKMTEEITKFSSELNRDAVFKKTSKISRLPAYLSVQVVRFFYKEKEQVSAKILKDVKFPERLDIMDLCTDSLKKELLPARDLLKKVDDHQVETVKQPATKKSKVESKNKEFAKWWLGDDFGSNNSGIYELKAVLTHKGRASNSGHYVAWVRNGDHWIMYDDENVVPITKEDVLKLSGGGDWHCAYLLLYGSAKIDTDSLKEVQEKQNGATTTEKK